MANPADETATDSMDLILWRHADAQDGTPDMTRALTAKGRKQAQQVAGWLKGRLPKDTRILVSPAIRTRQTADALQLEYSTDNDLAPGQDSVHILSACGWPDATGTVLVVGHQPGLGEVASLLLFGEARPMSIKKAGIVWLTNRVRAGETQTVLKAAVTPEVF
jgi:phosphohistidine phosphatase